MGKGKRKNKVRNRGHEASKAHKAAQTKAKKPEKPILTPAMERIGRLILGITNQQMPSIINQLYELEEEGGKSAKQAAGMRKIILNCHTMIENNLVAQGIAKLGTGSNSNNPAFAEVQTQEDFKPKIVKGEKGDEAVDRQQQGDKDDPGEIDDGPEDQQEDAPDEEEAEDE